MKKQIRPLFLFICIIAFAFALGLSMAEEAMAGPTDCCSFQLPGCGVSYGIKLNGFCNCAVQSACFQFCAGCG